ncbi:diacylglycerol/lipid kinase family protein [Mitsuokella multacida]|uniref:Lipid kinase, YegS/Rv2252/BmrU family n=1 Tax=Mitsuokella multacida DSM 20544 TaxID=500635 RepID=C9KPT6_9FIRM|nr:YegS/Rv2252/BmrU family lipid kinase [Mitsuokella multacida]EEX68241.1 lipid kinase, YegS/Rv2252/BmrU family [Mitsuokella multacida DSM 20544]
MKKLVLFYNPVSGHAAFKNKLDWIVEAFQRRGILVVFYRTRREGNEAFIPFVREVNPDGLLVAGGDGTVHEIVNLMMKGNLDLPLGIIGSGTSNDFATYLGVNTDLEAYLDTIASGRTRRVDLGLMDGTYFINVASGGAMACIAHEVNARIKNSLGKMAYYLKGIGDLPKFRYFPLKIEADGAHYELETFLFVIINSPVVGSMKNVANGVAVDDGKLDLLSIGKCSIPKLMSITADLIAGKPVSEREDVLHVQAKHFHIESGIPVESDIDGECGPMLPLTIETVPRAVAIYC